MVRAARIVALCIASMWLAARLDPALAGARAANEILVIGFCVSAVPLLLLPRDGWMRWPLAACLFFAGCMPTAAANLLRLSASSQTPVVLIVFVMGLSVVSLVPTVAASGRRF